MAVFEIKLTCPGCARECRAIISDGINSAKFRCSACGHPLFGTTAIKGYVYVLSNPRMPGLLKIGCTTRPVEERVQGLNGAAGVPEPFVVEAYFRSPSPDEHEALIHRKLATQRVKGKEFFEVDLSVALRIVEEVVQSGAAYEVGGSVRSIRESGAVLAGTVGRWSCGLCKHEWVATVLRGALSAKARQSCD
jgi:T5orf172 domain